MLGLDVEGVVPVLLGIAREEKIAEGR